VKNYSILSKVILIFCVCGIIATVINRFTGIINTAITSGASVVCIMGFVISGVEMITFEEAINSAVFSWTRKIQYPMEFIRK
jgi:hypothetical protein